MAPPGGNGGYGGTKTMDVPVAERFTPTLTPKSDVEVHDAIEDASAQFKDLALRIDENLPDGRDKSIALDYLENSFRRVETGIGHSNAKMWS